MSVEVTIRHMVLSESLQLYAQEKADKLREKFPSIEFIRVVLDKDGPNCVAALSIQGGQRTSVESTDKHTEVMTAINAAFDKAEAQLRKNSQRRQDIRS
ncbi:MAG: HPF/RaiA family ribosome-associated protein [Lentisphaerae bacterium]|jgi:ribosomal subunit interface protein|nr:HPF/RaiA family ribosome-associated protein [Lentisphaerota bacterium]